MTDAEREELVELTRELRERVEDVENELLALKELPHRLSEMKGTVDTLLALSNRYLPDIGERVDKLSGFKMAMQFAATVLVPILVAVVAGYFALRAAIPDAVPTPAPKEQTR